MPATEDPQASVNTLLAASDCAPVMPMVPPASTAALTSPLIGRPETASLVVQALIAPTTLPARMAMVVSVATAA
jgi:hypothetical protein